MNYCLNCLNYLNILRKLFIVLNYCEGGDLGKTVMAAKRNHTIIQEIQIVKWMTQVKIFKYICILTQYFSIIRLV